MSTIALELKHTAAAPRKASAVSKPAKIMASVVAMVLAVAIVLLSTLVLGPYLKSQKLYNNFPVAPYVHTTESGDRIHFLNVGHSDCILLESDGHFALVDGAEDSENPRGFESLELQGYEDVVLKYLKDYAASEDGKVYLDWVLGTHAHSDHIGGFDTIISDPDIVVAKAFLKEYTGEEIISTEVDTWDNQEMYDEMYEALVNEGAEIVSNPTGDPFMLGNFTITLYNTVDNRPEGLKRGENDQSFGVLVEKNGMRAFLSGDIDNLSGDERRLAPTIGDVDLLKLGHHGYPFSTSEGWLRTLNPEVCVLTNVPNWKINANIFDCARIANAPALLTGVENGIIAEFTENEIVYYNNIH